jgi:hypothetical protein
MPRKSTPTTPVTNDDSASVNSSSSKRSLTDEQKAKMRAGMEARKARLAAMSEEERTAFLDAEKEAREARKAERVAKKAASAAKKAAAEAEKAARKEAREAAKKAKEIAKESKPKRVYTDEQKSKMLEGIRRWNALSDAAKEELKAAKAAARAERAAKKAAKASA